MAQPSRRRLLACACGIGLGLAPALCRAQDWTLPARLPRPELASEEGGLWALVDRQEARVRRSAFILRDPALQTYLTSLLERMAGEHVKDARIYPVRTPHFNASMAPNGMMQVWSGLMLRAENEAQLASVLGHELGHYLQRHSLQQLQDAKARSAWMGVLAFAGGVGLIGQLALLAGMAAYSREQESEADRIGLILMRRGGWDPREAAKIWTHLRAELSAGAGGDPAARSVMFASHPGMEDRHQKLTELAGDAGGDRAEAAYQRAIEPLMADLIDDELRRTQYEETVVLMTRLHELRPTRGDLLWARGEARRLGAKADDQAAAGDDLQRVLTLDSPPAMAHRSLGLMARSQGRKADARASFENYLRAAPQAADHALIQSYLQELT